MNTFQINRKVTTGFRLLDKYTGGWVLPSLVLLSGEAGVGITSLALKFSKSFMWGSENELGVLYFSLKLEKRILWNRLLSSSSGISIDKIREEDLYEDENKHLDEILLSICDYKLHIEDRKYLSTSDFVQKIREVCSKNPIGMVIIDYLQISDFDGDKSSQAWEKIAKEFNLVLIVLLKKSPEFLPTIYLDKEVFDPAYGSLVIRSDLVIFLSDHEFEDPESVAQQNALPQYLSISKNRFGPTKNLDVVFFRESLSYADPNRHDA